MPSPVYRGGVASLIDADCALLVQAYRAGAFPMARPDALGRPIPGRAGIHFYQADPRAIIPLEPPGPRLPRSARALLRRSPFTITCDQAFAQVIGRCADSPREGRWINDWIVSRYTALHDRGLAHSVEAWSGDAADSRRLVGGLYGVHVGGAFFGESMFSDLPAGGSGASKVCYVRLIEHLRRRGFRLLDAQFINPHTALLGAVEITADAYSERLHEATAMDIAWGAWDAPASGP